MFMSDAAEMAERHGRILARLTELGLSLAEKLHARAMAAEEPKEAADLGLAFHRISRSLRQTLALEAKLVRDAQAAERETLRDEAARRELLREIAPRDPRRIARRKDEVRDAVHRVIWDEVEDDDERHYLSDLLEQRLEIGARDNDFGLDDLKAHIDRLLADFDLAGHILTEDDETETGEFRAPEFDSAPPAAPWPPPH